MNKLDLNLLKVLEILLEELNVTATANRLNLSQSAVSKHLSRLRTMFDDPLFERTAQGLKPTPRTLELAPQLRQIIQQLEQLTRPNAFEPALSERQFSLHMSEAAYSLTLPFFMPKLLSQAPNVRLKTQTWHKTSLNELQRCEVDMGIACREWDQRSALHINQIPPDINHAELLQDHSLCLVREGHPALSKPWSIETFLQYRHIQVTLGGVEHWLLDEVLKIKQLHRDIAIDMPDFHSAMILCEHSDLILCAPARHVAKLAVGFKLQVLPMPIEMAPGAYVLLWHKHYEHDSGHRWLRELIINGVAEKT
ncbi:MAG: LysR family transcriptional regulator [Gammaproteobacteria bacterium]|nr:LysR family transcriptional regulator [Gammaproteobacteria bacterium]